MRLPVFNPPSEQKHLDLLVRRIKRISDTMLMPFRTQKVTQ